MNCQPGMEGCEDAAKRVCALHQPKQKGAEVAPAPLLLVVFGPRLRREVLGHRGGEVVAGLVHRRHVAGAALIDRRHVAVAGLGHFRDAIHTVLIDVNFVRVTASVLCND